MFLYFVSSNCLCRFSSTLTDVRMDTSTKLATFSLEEEVLTEFIPKHVRLCGLHFGRFICNCLNCYFTTSRLYLHLNCFLNLFPPFTSSPGPSNWDLLYERKIFEIKNAMVMFISIEYSEPKILTWNLHHHSPSYSAVFFCLREKLARHVALLDSPVNFPEKYSSQIVC